MYRPHRITAQSTVTLKLPVCKYFKSWFSIGDCIMEKIPYRTAKQMHMEGFGGFSLLRFYFYYYVPTHALTSLAGQDRLYYIP
jgi:hypothetical protein